MKILRLIVRASAAALASVAIASSAHALSAEEFVHKASIAGNFEIESSRLALDRSQNGDVKAFAQRMIDDHTKAANELKSTARDQHLDSSLSEGLDAKHKAILAKLQSAQGEEFDDQYAAKQTSAHKEAVSLFGDYAKHGDNAALKDFASRTLPTLKDHLKHVKKLKV